MSQLLELGLSLQVLIRIAGLSLLAGTTAGVFAIGYRWYAREQIPRSLAVLIGLGAIALWLNTLVALTQFIDPIDEPLTPTAAFFDVVAFVLGGVTAEVGRHLGDRTALRSITIVKTRGFNGSFDELDSFVRTIGRVISVTIPVKIEDIDGYDPVSDGTKESIAGKTILFPRGLTQYQLRERFIERLQNDHGIKHVDAEFSEEGVIKYLAIGGRMAGLGPTLAPGTVAIALRADPASNSSPGDTVQVWNPGNSPTLVTTGELRGTSGDIVTLAIDEGEVDKIDSTAVYKLVTLPADSRADREFAAMLRTADETMDIVTIAESSSLIGTTIGKLKVTIVAIKTANGDVSMIPPRDHELRPGNTVYAIGLPEELRRFEALATKA